MRSPLLIGQDIGATLSRRNCLYQGYDLITNRCPHPRDFLRVKFMPERREERSN